MIRHRYQALSILSDFLLGILSLVGSVLFLFDPLYTAAVWLFITPSALLVARPMIRLAHYLHLNRRPTGEWDF